MKELWRKEKMPVAFLVRGAKCEVFGHSLGLAEKSICDLRLSP